MGRVGIYKSEVARARQALLALGRHPSIDAVRIELGNTGSKATIHRYLKQIEEEEGGTVGTEVSVSDALRDLVGRLAARLQEEAEQRVTQAKAAFEAQLLQAQSQQREAQKQIEAQQLQLARTEVELTDERRAYAETSIALQQNRLEGTRCAQRVSDLQAQLEQSERFRNSLEEKYDGARVALDRFQAAAREQREREKQLNDEQVRTLHSEHRRTQDALTATQAELGRVQREHAKFAGELEATREALKERQAQIARLGEDLRALDELRPTVERLQRELADRDKALSDSRGERQSLEQERSAACDRVQRLEVELAAVTARTSTQEALNAELRALLAVRVRGAAKRITRRLDTATR